MAITFGENKIEYFSTEGDHVVTVEKLALKEDTVSGVPGFNAFFVNSAGEKLKKFFSFGTTSLWAIELLYLSCTGEKLTLKANDAYEAMAHLKPKLTGKNLIINVAFAPSKKNNPKTGLPYTERNIKAFKTNNTGSAPVIPEAMLDSHEDEFNEEVPF